MASPRVAALRDLYRRSRPIFAPPDMIYRLRRTAVAGRRAHGYRGSHTMALATAAAIDAYATVGSTDAGLATPLVRTAAAGRHRDQQRHRPRRRLRRRPTSSTWCPRSTAAPASCSRATGGQPQQQQAAGANATSARLTRPAAAWFNSRRTSTAPPSRSTRRRSADTTCSALRPHQPGDTGSHPHRQRHRLALPASERRPAHRPGGLKFDIIVINFFTHSRSFAGRIPSFPT